jgi:hypothetical protein
MVNEIAVERPPSTECVSGASSRDKFADRARIESMYLARQISKEHFYGWLKLGGHYVL